MAKANDRSAKDKQMSARLKAEGAERKTGRCAICGREIQNGNSTYNHYAAHARGASENN